MSLDAYVVNKMTEICKFKPERYPIYLWAVLNADSLFKDYCPLRCDAPNTLFGTQTPTFFGTFFFNLITGLDRPWGFLEVEAPRFQDNRHMKVVECQPYAPAAFTPEKIFLVDCVWNVMAHAQKPDFVFRRNGRVLLNRQGRQFSRQLAAEVCASAVVMLDIPSSEVVWRVLATPSIRQFPLHFPSRASPCAITFQLDSIHFC